MFLAENWNRILNFDQRESVSRPLSQLELKSRSDLVNSYPEISIYIYVNCRSQSSAETVQKIQKTVLLHPGTLRSLSISLA